MLSKQLAWRNNFLKNINYRRPINEKRKNRFVTGIVTAGVLFSTAIPFNVLAENPISQIESSNAHSILSKLSKEQRLALQTVDANPGFTISPDINTSSSEPVNIIVEFQTAPVKINELKQKEKKDYSLLLKI